MLEWLGQPVAASAHAGEVDNLMALVHWMMLVLFVGWSAFFLYVLVRYRRRRNPKAVYAGVSSRWPATVEASVLIAEVVLLVFFSIPAWSARVDAIPEEHTSTVVRVIAEQFAWNAHYPGPDGRFGRTDIRMVGPDNPVGLDRRDPAAKDDLTTINALNLPVGKPVLVFLSTKDVIHSFGLPQMRVKQDAIPGIVQPVWFTPTQTGSWEIACSQLCGLGHYRMKGGYTIQSQADFEAWFKEEKALSEQQ
jgi:cytochrome c oxidase subunit 2